MAGIALRESGTGGEVVRDSGGVVLDATVATQIYLALFGGNVEGDTSSERRPSGERASDWMGNLFLNEKNQYNSRTERAIRKMVGAGGLRLVEQAAVEDLQQLVPTILKSGAATAQMTGSGRVNLFLDVVLADGAAHRVAYEGLKIGNDQ